MEKVWDLLIILVQLLAGFGLFFVGVRSFSEGVQALFGKFIRTLINSVESGRFWNWGVGALTSMLLITAALTATMVIGFVNSGLLGFAQAISLLLGAQLGGAALSWLLAFPNFHLNPMYFVAFGLVIQLWLRNERAQSVGKSLFSVGLLLWGYVVMTTTFVVLRGTIALDPWWVSWGEITPSLRLMGILLGVLFAFTMRAGGALLGVIFSLALSGLVSAEGGLILLIGITIGQALFPLVASVKYNRGTQRVAVINIGMQTIGALFIILFVPNLDTLINGLIPQLDSRTIDMNGLYIYAPIHLALAHTIYAFVLGLPFLLSLPQVESLANTILPARKIKEAQQLVFLGARYSLAPSLAIEQAYQEVKKLAAMVQTMLSITETTVRNGKIEPADFRRVSKYEKITDNIQSEVFTFLELVMAAHLTRDQAQRVRSLMRMVDELESIADKCLTISEKFQDLIIEHDTDFVADLKELSHLLSEVLRFYEVSFGALTEADTVNFTDAKQRISEFADRLEILRLAVLERLQHPKVHGPGHLIINELLAASLSIKEHTLNVIEAYHGGAKISAPI